MKKLLLMLLVCFSTSAFAQDVNTYEELPDCFFDVDNDNTYKHHDLQDFIRAVGVDTCNTGDIVSYWPHPVNSYNSLTNVLEFKDTLVARDKIYSDMFFEIQLNSFTEPVNICKPQSEELDYLELELDSILPDYKSFYTLFKNKLDNISNSKIYVYDFAKNDSNYYEPQKIALKFEKYVSFKDFFAILADNNFVVNDPFVMPPVSVAAEFAKGIKIKDNYILFEEVKKQDNCRIYDLNGKLILEKPLQLGKNQTLDIHNLNFGVYFLQFGNSNIKFIKD